MDESNGERKRKSRKIIMKGIRHSGRYEQKRLSSGGMDRRDSLSIKAARHSVHFPSALPHDWAKRASLAGSGDMSENQMYKYWHMDVKNIHRKKETQHIERRISTWHLPGAEISARRETGIE